MQINKIALYVVLLLAFGLFYYFLQGGQEETEVSDSVASSENPDKTVDQDTFPSLAGEDLAPGTAFITATILSVNDTDDGQDRMNIRVNEVLGYGSSTPVLASDTDLVVDVTSFFKANSNLRDSIEDGTEIKAVISYQQSMAMGDESATGRWRLQDLKK